MGPIAGYGHWLKHKVSSGLFQLQRSTAGSRWSYTAGAGVLSALLIVLALVQYEGGAYFEPYSFQKQEASKGVVSSATGAWTLPRIDRAMQQKAPTAPDPASDEWDNTVALCVMTSNAHPYDLLEWVQYHKWLGVDKIFLRENKSGVVKKHPELFQDMMDDGFLDFGPWEGDPPESTQLWFNRCSASDLGGGFSWVLFPDADQYMVLLDKGVAMEKPDLKAFLLKRRELRGLSLPRVEFGSSGHRERPSPGGPLNHYTYCKDLFSFPPICMASSFHLCSTPFTDSDDLGQCAYKKQHGPEEGYQVDIEYGDSTPAWDLKWAVVDTSDARSAQPHLSNEPGEEKCVAYDRKLHDPGFGSSPRNVALEESLVLFHYVTRSYEEFIDREPRLPGVLEEQFRERWEASRAAAATDTGDVDGVTTSSEKSTEDKVPETDAQIEAREAFDAFEERHVFNRQGTEHAICASVIEAGYVDQCCGQTT